jgi:O-antigen ligase
LATALLLLTFFVNDDALWLGLVTAKYFWFAAALCIVSIISGVAGLYSRTTANIRIGDFAVAFFAAYMTASFIVRREDASMQWLLLMLMAPLYFVVRSADRRHYRAVQDALCAVVFIEAAWGILQFCGWLPGVNAWFRITGTFLNPGPYSGFLAAGLPVVIGRLMQSAGKWSKSTLLIVLLACVAALLLAFSRAAILAAAVSSGFIILCRKRTVRNRKNIAVRAVGAVLLAALLLAVLYYLRKDSADGRLLIWRFSTAAVAENPCWGAGYGCFEHAVGEAQAAWFGSGRATAAQAMLADDPGIAFNEYLRLAVEIGLAGLALFLLTVATALSGICKAFDKGNFAPFAMTSLLVFAAFSYPLGILPLRMLFVALLAMSANESRRLIIKTYRRRHSKLPKLPV